MAEVVLLLHVQPNDVYTVMETYRGGKLSDIEGMNERPEKALTKMFELVKYGREVSCMFTDPIAGL